MNNYIYTNIKQTLIDDWCSKDNQRPNLMKDQDWLNNQNEVNYWCVTDAHTALMILGEKIGSSGSADLDYGGVISNLVKLEHPILLTLNEVRCALGKFESEPGFDEVYKECEACKGEGEITCDSCKHEHQCETCDGDGELLVSKTSNGKLHYTSRTDTSITEIIKIGEGLFNPNFISKIGNTIKMLGLKDSIIQVTHNDDKKGSIFLVGDIMFLIMPITPMSNQLVKAILPTPNL